MVKNTKGGKGAKSLARKMVFADSREKTYIRLPTSPLEQFALTTHMYGNMCQVTTIDGNSYKCVIRGKFTGRKKRQSFVSVGKILLVGFRDFEAPNFKLCDLLEVYDDNEIIQLATTPGIDIHSLLSHSSSISTHSSLLSTQHPLDDLFSHSTTPLPQHPHDTLLPTQHTPLTPLLQDTLDTLDIPFDDI
jgi:hypothetical protein